MTRQAVAYYLAKYGAIAWVLLCCYWMFRLLSAGVQVTR